MGITGYTSLSLREKDYKRIRKEFDKTVVDDLDHNSFTQWATNILENAVNRTGKLKLKFPHLSVIKVFTNGLVIEDSKNNAVVKVTMSGKDIICSDSGKNFESYLLYASLHPMFWR